MIIKTLNAYTKFNLAQKSLVFSGQIIKKFIFKLNLTENTNESKNRMTSKFQILDRNEYPYGPKRQQICNKNSNL